MKIIVSEEEISRILNAHFGKTKDFFKFRIIAEDGQINAVCETPIDTSFVIEGIDHA